MSIEISCKFNKLKIRIIQRALLAYMTRLIVKISINSKCKAYVLVETKKMEACQNDIPIGIIMNHSPKLSSDLK